MDRDAIRRLNSSLSRIGLGEEPPDDQGEIVPLGSRSLGSVHMAQALREDISLGGLLREIEGRRRQRRPHERAFFAMVAHRLLDPGSKRSCRQRWLADEVYLPEAAGNSDRFAGAVPAGSTARTDRRS